MAKNAAMERDDTVDASKADQNVACVGMSPAFHAQAGVQLAFAHASACFFGL